MRHLNMRRCSCMCLSVPKLFVHCHSKMFVKTKFGKPILEDRALSLGFQELGNHAFSFQDYLFQFFFFLSWFMFSSLEISFLGCRFLLLLMALHHARKISKWPNKVQFNLIIKMCCVIESGL